MDNIIYQECRGFSNGSRLGKSSPQTSLTLPLITFFYRISLESGLHWPLSIIVKPVVVLSYMACSEISLRSPVIVYILSTLIVCYFINIHFVYLLAYLLTPLSPFPTHKFVLFCGMIVKIQHVSLDNSGLCILLHDSDCLLFAKFIECGTEGMVSTL